MDNFPILLKGKAAQIGEIHRWKDGNLYQKAEHGWVPVRASADKIRADFANGRSVVGHDDWGDHSDFFAHADLVEKPMADSMFDRMFDLVGGKMSAISMAKPETPKPKIKPVVEPKAKQESPQLDQSLVQKPKKEKPKHPIQAYDLGNGFMLTDGEAVFDAASGKKYMVFRIFQAGKNPSTGFSNTIAVPMNQDTDKYLTGHYSRVKQSFGEHPLVGAHKAAAVFIGKNIAKDKSIPEEIFNSKHTAPRDDFLSVQEKRILDVLSEKTFLPKKRMGEGMSNPWKVEFAGGTQAIFKANFQSGEFGDNPHFGFGHPAHEEAVFKISKLLRFALDVPPAKFVGKTTIDRGKGPEHIGFYAMCQFRGNASTLADKPEASSKLDHDDMANLYVMDFVTAHFDRHAANILVKKKPNGKYAAIPIDNAGSLMPISGLKASEDGGNRLWIGYSNDYGYYSHNRGGRVFAEGGEGRVPEECIQSLETVTVDDLDASIGHLLAHDYLDDDDRDAYQERRINKNLEKFKQTKGMKVNDPMFMANYRHHTLTRVVARCRYMAKLLRESGGVVNEDFVKKATKEAFKKTNGLFYLPKEKEVR